MKIDDAIQGFATYIATERKLAEKTIVSYMREVERFGGYAHDRGLEEIEEIEARDIRDWQMSLLEEGEAVGTVNRQLAALRAWFRYMRRKNYLDRDIMLKVSSPKKPHRLPIFFRESETVRIYDDIYPHDYDGGLDRLVLTMLYETGMRRAEMSDLTLGSVDLVARNIKVRGKGDKERYIPIEKELADRIEHYMAERDAMLESLAAEGRGEAAGDRLLVNSHGRPLSTGMIYDIVEKYMKPISHADRCSPHVFRHTFATHMLNEGASIGAIKELLGHSDLSSTEVYTHVTREHLKETYKHAHPRASKQ